MYIKLIYASPNVIGEIDTSDPMYKDVIAFWEKTAEHVYNVVPKLGGFFVTADSENRPGPFTYNRNHAEGANMLGKAVEPYGGNVIWRCFVYNNKQHWRDRTTDRAPAGQDTSIAWAGQL